MLCSNLLVLSMTFERFYGIVKPHKATSFNTVKKATITIILIVIFTICFNMPHVFLSSLRGGLCVPFGKIKGNPYGEFYFWLSFVVNYAIPFVLLLAMNSVIIHKIHNRSNFMVIQNESENTGPGQNKATKIKNSDKQVYAILLLVAFGFLILTTPGYLFFLFAVTVDFRTCPKKFAVFYLFYNVAEKLHYTNHGINFFFYVTSGQKFRTDLITLLRCKKKKGPNGVFPIRPY